jgi:serine phosphatase RsbU (regulator of sigma subunit)
MNIEQKVLDKEILEQYKKQLPRQILEFYPLVLSALILVLSLFCITDIMVRQIPVLISTRIAPIFFSILLLVVRYTRLRTKSHLVIWINNLFSLSMFAMGFGILFITFNTVVFKSSISALIIITVANYFFIKGKNNILIIFSLVFIAGLSGLFVFVKPNLSQWQELMNPAAVFFGVFLVSLLSERSRFNEFYFKTKLENEKEKSQYLFKETLAQNEELEQQKEEILSINDKLEQRSNELQLNLEVITELNDSLKKKNQDITASINYARRIQEALLPNMAYINQVFPDNFILYKPCDIVSGDFYWTRQLENYRIMAVADCTGHGVPGAFMSILGMSLLNEIVLRNYQAEPGKILNILRDKLKESLHDISKQNSSDGMDIGLFIVNDALHEIQYAGAYHPLLIISDDEYKELKGDKMPIGKYIKEANSFTTHKQNINGNERFYMFSDGFQDQLGGEEKKRYLSTRFKKHLNSGKDLPFNKQKQSLEQEFEKWRNENPQVDDILIIGFKI